MEMLLVEEEVDVDDDGCGGGTDAPRRQLVIMEERGC